MGGFKEKSVWLIRRKCKFFSLFLAVILLFDIASFAAAQFHSKSTNTIDKDNDCFCELKGSIDDCSCNIDTVDYFNNNKIYPRLRSLLTRDYFRFWKVNLRKDCPFWSDDSKCAMRSCHVSMCEEKDIPEGLKGAHSQEESAYKYHPDQQQVLTDCDHNFELSYLNKTLSEKAMHGFEIWADFDEQQDNFCILDDHQNGAEYVDLLLNPEKFTGYRGSSAHRIWRSIYLENCFVNQGAQNALLNHINKMPKALSNLCMEQRAFYRLLSGVHTSINIHLCSNYLMAEPTGFMAASDSNGVWGRNLDEFMRRFSPETTKNEGPNWLKNLYFVYLLELRALAKAAPYLKKESFFTGNKDEDESVRIAVNDILHIIEGFPSHFNESLMFNGTAAIELKADFREKFRNISRIMDCVGCDKCRLWGKLQVQGLGTALKILFSGRFEPVIEQSPLKSVRDSYNRRFKLKRSEIVSLFNSFARLSTSINELEEFRKVMSLEYLQPIPFD